jgi:hypothetical protein
MRISRTTRSCTAWGQGLWGRRVRDGMAVTVSTQLGTRRRVRAPRTANPDSTASTRSHDPGLPGPGGAESSSPPIHEATAIWSTGGICSKALLERLRPARSRSSRVEDGWGEGCHHRHRARATGLPSTGRIRRGHHSLSRPRGERFSRLRAPTEAKSFHLILRSPKEQSPRRTPFLFAARASRVMGISVVEK